MKIKWINQQVNNLNMNLNRSNHEVASLNGKIKWINSRGDQPK
jgi:peptidoglycan hydrolase CwlO-like protein